MSKLSELIKKEANLFNALYIFEQMEEILPEEIQNVDTENINITEITDDSITVIVGGDWEGGTEVKFRITDDFKLEVVEHKQLKNEE